MYIEVLIKLRQSLFLFLLLLIRKWRLEQEQRLAEKDQRSQEELQEWLQQAQQDLADWEARQAEQLAKAKQDNR